MRTILAWLTAIVVALAGVYAVSRVSAALADKDAQIKSLTEAARQAQARAKRDRQVLVARQAQIASQARKSAVAQEALKTALQAEKEWNDTEVPPRVREALQATSDGLGGDSGVHDSDGLLNACPGGVCP